MTILKWPALERPRERLLAFGAESLSNTELLAILLGKGSKGQSVIELARTLLNQCNGISGILASSFQEITRLPGMGPAKFSTLQAAAELYRRSLSEPLQKKSILLDSSMTARQFIHASLKSAKQEVFAALFLDNKRRLIHFEKLFYGTINKAVVHPREIVKRGLLYNAQAVIIAHNHPSGDPAPSEADQSLTSHILESLQMVDIQLLDHIIVANDRTVSMAENGLL